MTISFTLEDTTQLTDGNWNGEPTATPTPEFTDPEDDVTFDLSLSDGLTWTATLDLEVIGDLNANGEVLEVTYGGETAVLFDNNYTNDVWFDGEATGPTNGTANPLIGAQPNQGQVTINGHQGSVSGNEFTQDDIVDIQNDEAVFASNSSVSVSGNLGEVSDGTLTINYAVTEYPDSEQGVDFAQIQSELTVSGNWYGDHAISNVVFYFQCGEDIVKLKIDDWDEYGYMDGDVFVQYKFYNTEAFDFSEEKLLALAEECGFGEDCDFIGMTLKAGNNFEDGFRPNQTNGEGEIIFGDISDEYGKQNDFDCVVDLTDVVDTFLFV